jgi:hypothetical protein
MVLSAEQVSREHAIVRIVQDKLEIEDLASRNGTLVNGVAVQGKRWLDAGDVIEIGGERVEVLRRVSRDQTATEQGEVSVDPATKTQRDLLELVEELSARATDSKDREPLVQTLRGLVSTLVQAIERSGRRLTRAEAARLVTVARSIAGWSNHSSATDLLQAVERAVADPKKQ